MRFVLKHEIKGRMRLHAVQNRMSFAQADTLQYYLEQQDMIESVKVNERTCDVVITYTGSREGVISIVKKFSYSASLRQQNFPAHAGADGDYDREIRKIHLERSVYAVQR